MDDTGMMTLKLASFANYIETKSEITANEIDIYELFQDYLERGEAQTRALLL